MCKYCVSIGLTRIRLVTYSPMGEIERLGKVYGGGARDGMVVVKNTPAIWYKQQHVAYAQKQKPM